MSNNAVNVIVNICMINNVRESPGECAVGLSSSKQCCHVHCKLSYFENDVEGENVLFAGSGFLG